MGAGPADLLLGVGQEDRLPLMDGNVRRTDLNLECQQGLRRGDCEEAGRGSAVPYFTKFRQHVLLTFA